MSIDERVRAQAVGPQHVVAPATRRRLSTPQWIRLLCAACLVATIAVVVICQVAVGIVRSGWNQIGHQMAPQVVSTTGVTFALNDMDAQLANVLLVAYRSDLGVTRQQSLDLYESDRRTVNSNLQQAAVLAGTDPAAVERIRTVLDGLGRYEALAAQVVLLESQADPAVPGRPPAAALTLFRQASDLMHDDLLPAVAALTEANSAALDHTYDDRRAAIADGRLLLILVGLILIGVLVWLQVFLARRVHRIINPALLAATVISAAVVIGGSAVLTREAQHLTVAKKDAFDSILVLTRARAVSYDANADESRYLLDPQRANRYEQAFLEKSSQVIGMPGATIPTFDALYDDAVRSYRTDHDDLRFTGFLGTEFRNITFAGEREAAEATLTAFQVYQRDDRRIRALNTSGDLNAAIQLCTSYAPGGSNAAFSAYDKTLVHVTAINQNAFDDAVAAGERGLRGWNLIPWVAGALAVLLVLAGVRPRLAEYR